MIPALAVPPGCPYPSTCGCCSAPLTAHPSAEPGVLKPPMASETLLPQVGHIPICVAVAGSAGPRGSCPILMSSLQPWVALVTNILCAGPIFTVCLSRAGLSLAQALPEMGWIDTASFPWAFLSAKSFRASNYHFSSRKLLFFFLQRE